MDFVLPPAPPISLPVTGSDKRFPVGHIYCIGRNYSDHVREMGGDASRSEPVFFTKPARAIVQSGVDIPYPPNTQNLHYELEWVVAIGESGIFGYGVGLDMTRRDIQSLAKDSAGPWDRAKAFPNSAPCSALTPVSDIEITGAQLTLRKNGETVQSSNIDKMIWSVDEIITRLNADMGLRAGDIIYTGTPAGVGPVSPGDELRGSMTGLEDIIVRFTA